MIHSKLFSIFVATAAVALGAFVAGCAFEGSEPGDPSLGEASAPLSVQGQEAKALEVNAAAAQPNNVVVRPLQIAPVVKEDHLLGGGGGGSDEGPRPHPWMPGPDQGEAPDTNTNNNGGSASDNKSSK